MIILLPILALLGALSPLLTLAWLWQVKEWRWDRLLEHLRREGWFPQLWGRLRPGIFTVFVIAVISTQSVEDARVLLTIATLMVFALLTAVQMLARRQRIPILTQKAAMMIATAMLLSIVTMVVMVLTLPMTLPAIVLLQPLMLALAWIILRPLDLALKNRIIERAKRIRAQHRDLAVIGVTGSVGKTTTKELLACVLQDLTPAVTPAYMNSEIGVARWLIKQLAKSNTQLFIAEMGAYRLGEISLLCSFVQPTLGVITHVGTQHIALFGSQKNLFDAKSELIEALPEEGHAFLNGDNELARVMAGRSPCPVTVVGTGGRCDLEAFDIEETPSGIRMRVADTLFDVPLHGTHNVSNVLLALAVGQHLGIPMQRMRDLLKNFRPLSQTFSVRTENGVRILDDTHNSSVASVKAAIAWARVQPESHKILLAAGLIEMGDLQTSAEEELGALAGSAFERTVVTDAQSARNFAAGGALHCEALSKQTQRIPAGALLVCTGRMSESMIRTLLPSHYS